MGKIKRERQKFHISAAGDDVPMGEIEKSVPFLVQSSKSSFNETENIFAGIDIKLDAINKLPKPDAVTDADPSAGKSTQAGSYKRKAKSEVVPTTSMPDDKRPERQQSKKQKRELKHSKLMEKINVVQQARQRVKDKQQKKSKKEEPSNAKASPLPASAELATLKAKLSTAFGAPKVAAPTKVPQKKFNTSLKTLEDALPSLKDSLPSLDSVLKLKSSAAKTGMTEDEVDGVGKCSGKKNKKKSQSIVQGKVPLNANKSRSNKSKEMIKRFNHMQKLLSDEQYKKNPRAVIAQHVTKKARDRNRGIID